LIALPLAAGLLSALLFLSVAKGIAFGVLLSYAAPLPLLMAGLGLGMGAAAIASIVGAAAVAMVVGEFAALPFMVAVGLPGVIVANRALLWRADPDGTTVWYPPGLVLAWLAAAGLALILIGAALVSGHPDGVRGWIAEVIGRTLELVAPEVAAEDRSKAVEWWTPLFPAMVVGSWLLMAALNSVGAQGLLVRMGRNRRPSPAYRELWLPDWLALVLVVAAAAGMLAGGDLGYIGLNAALVSLVPFAFLGVAGIHRWAAGKSQARFILAVTYGLLILAFGWAAMAAAGLGLVRFWKMRFRRGDSGGGEEG
jgi:hypothetical protein